MNRGVSNKVLVKKKDMFHKDHMKPTPQQEHILEILRDKNWHCSSEFGYIKDDRKRISELNEGYMKEKGFEIRGKICDGRCGKSHSSGLFMRRAEKLTKMNFQEYWDFVDKK